MKPLNQFSIDFNYFEDFYIVENEKWNYIFCSLLPLLDDSADVYYSLN